MHPFISQWVVSRLILLHRTRFIDNEFEMPDKLVALLVRFLEQNQGLLSKRAMEKEFEALTETEVNQIEMRYKELFKAQ